MTKILRPNHRRILKYLVDGGEFETEETALQTILDRALRLADVKAMVIRALFNLGWTEEQVMKVQLLLPGKPSLTLKVIKEVSEMYEGLAEGSRNNEVT